MHGMYERILQETDSLLDDLHLRISTLLIVLKNRIGLGDLITAARTQITWRYQALASIEIWSGGSPA